MAGGSNGGGCHNGGGGAAWGGVPPPAESPNYNQKGGQPNFNMMANSGWGQPQPSPYANPYGGRGRSFGVMGQQQPYSLYGMPQERYGLGWG